jgi:penicillin-binding protein 1A
MRRGEVRPRRHRFRRIRRVLGTVMALAVLGAVVFAGLLMVTPGVGDAPALTRAFDRARGAAYPGPPVPPRVADSLVAAEGQQFYSEAGIDPIAVARVIAGHLTGGPGQGGSTLYQQLAKMLYAPGRSGVQADAEQVLLGIKLGFSYPGAEIVRMYADVTYFGHGYYGLAAASCGYFGNGPARLSWGQAAMLAGLVRAPSADDPLSHLATARASEARVLGRLAATGRLTQAEAARAYRQPLHLAGRTARVRRLPSGARPMARRRCPGTGPGACAASAHAGAVTAGSSGGAMPPAPSHGHAKEGRGLGQSLDCLSRRQYLAGSG